MWVLQKPKIPKNFSPQIFRLAIIMVCIYVLTDTDLRVILTRVAIFAINASPININKGAINPQLSLHYPSSATVDKANVQFSKCGFYRQY